MGLRVTPLLRQALLCQRIEFRDGQPHALIVPLHTLSLTDDLFGKPLDSLFLYTQLEDALGTFEFSVRVEDEHQQLVSQPNLRSATYTFNRATQDPTFPDSLVLELFGLVFPAPGVYYFVVRCDGDSRSLHQRDGAARAPFLRILRS